LVSLWIIAAGFPEFLRIPDGRYVADRLLFISSFVVTGFTAAIYQLVFVMIEKHFSPEFFPNLRLSFIREFVQPFQYFNSRTANTPHA
jgi:hypothetical protein